MFVNKVILIGYVGADPEVRYLRENYSTASFSLATVQPSIRLKNGKTTEEHTDWHKIVSFGEQALFAENNIRKGHFIMIEGHISYRNYTNKSGIALSSTQIIAERIGYVGKNEK